MTALETGLIAASSSLAAALAAGLGLYLKIIGRVLSREDHDKACDKTLGPIRDDISKIEKTCRRLEDKSDDATKSMGEKLEAIRLQLAKMNGGQ